VSELADKAQPEEVLAGLRRLTDRCIVGVSLGKDSLAALELLMDVRPAWAAVHCYFMYLVPGLEFQEQYLRFLERRHGLTILRLPHFQLGRMLRGAVLRRYSRLQHRSPVVSPTEMEGYLRMRCEARWVVDGFKAIDSLERNAILRRTGPLDVRRGRCHPLAWWNHGRVFDLLRRRGVPLPADYQMFGHSFGRLWPAELLAIRERFPADYARILAMFPFAHAQVVRAELRKEQEREQAKPA
jgi:phosphoadenosine phosphosulfate reductase